MAKVIPFPPEAFIREDKATPDDALGEKLALSVAHQLVMELNVVCRIIQLGHAHQLPHAQVGELRSRCEDWLAVYDAIKRGT